MTVRVPARRRPAPAGSRSPPPSTPTPTPTSRTCRYGARLQRDGAAGHVAGRPGDGRVPRPLRVRRPSVVRRPAGLRAVAVGPRGWSERTVIGLVMQCLDNSLTVSPRRGGCSAGRRGSTSRQGHGEPNPTLDPGRATGAPPARGPPAAAHRRPGHARRVGRRRARRADDRALPRRLPDRRRAASAGCSTPTTGCTGYPGLHVVDGSAVSANLGVNPSLTITAQAERALSLWPQPRRGRPAAAARRRVPPGRARPASPPGGAPGRAGRIAPADGRMGRVTDSEWTVADIPDLDGVRAVVTGANSGLGFHTTLELARHGASVVLAVRDEARGADAVEQMLRAGAGRAARGEPARPRRPRVGAGVRRHRSRRSRWTCSSTTPA